MPACLGRCLSLLALMGAGLAASVPPPAAWVPARWTWTDPQTLDLLAGTPINCLLLERYTPEFARRAAERGIVTLAVLHPGADPAAPARQAVRAGVAGIVLEGDFPAGAAARARDALADSRVLVVELTSRARLPLGSSSSIIGTYQGVWPGIQVLENGAAKAAPSGSPWIDTNTGFIRWLRAWGPAAIWLGYRPPARSVITGERYREAIGDAELAGARWIIALDDDFAARLEHRQAAAMKEWHGMAQVLQFFESHAEWRTMRPYTKLAVVQGAADGILSGGILDMIAAKHTPVRSIPGPRLTAEALRGATMAVNADADELTPGQRQALQDFARGGSTVLTAPPGWKGQSALASDQITLDARELDRLNEMWHDVQTMIGHQNLGARLFNVASMLSNVVAAEDGRPVVIELVNYSAYPIENITVQMLGTFKHARLYTPEGAGKDLEVYTTEEGGTGIDIQRVSACAALRLD
jgi:hypothetical protein